MTNHGPTLPSGLGRVFNFVEVMLRATPRDLDDESMRYWSRHTGELQSQLREVMHTPGARVLEIPIGRPTQFADIPVLRQDPRASAVVEVDLTMVRFVRFSHLNDRQILLDERVLCRFHERQKVLPEAWKRMLRNEEFDSILFIGTLLEGFNNGVRADGARYVRVPSLQYDNRDRDWSAGTDQILKPWLGVDDNLRIQHQHKSSFDPLVAVLEP